MSVEVGNKVDGQDYCFHYCFFFSKIKRHSKLIFFSKIEKIIIQIRISPRGSPHQLISPRKDLLTMDFTYYYIEGWDPDEFQTKDDGTPKPAILMTQGEID